MLMEDAVSHTEPTQRPDPSFAELANKAAEAARLLRLLANERRMLVLCHLAGNGEATVTELAEAVGLGQSPLSQHLALMRQDGLVASRRDGVTMRYRIADPLAESLLGVLKGLYCPPQDNQNEGTDKPC